MTSADASDNRRDYRRTRKGSSTKTGVARAPAVASASLQSVRDHDRFAHASTKSNLRMKIGDSISCTSLSICIKKPTVTSMSALQQIRQALDPGSKAGNTYIWNTSALASSYACASRHKLKVATGLCALRTRPHVSRTPAVGATPAFVPRVVQRNKQIAPSLADETGLQ
jgi:hypothetical protein